MWATLFLRMMRGLIRDGALEITMPDGQVERMGDDSDPIRITLSDPDLPRRILFNPELAVGEAYMDETLTIAEDDLYGFIALGVRNFAVGHGEGLESRIAPLKRYFEQLNPVGRAQKYDLSGRLYDLFPDEDKQYSCAYFTDPDMSLEGIVRLFRRIFWSRAILC